MVDDGFGRMLGWYLMSYNGFRRLRWILMVEENAYRGSCEREVLYIWVMLSVLSPPLPLVGSSRQSLLPATLGFKLIMTVEMIVFQI